MKKLVTHEEIVFYKLEKPSEVLDLRFHGFDYFRGLGIVDYKRTFQTWLRKFPRPIIIVGVKRKKRVCLWVHVDEWDEGTAKDGNPVYVLRAIETLPSLRNRRLGQKLVLLALQQTVGYLITKPINPGATRFFSRIGFKAEHDFTRAPVKLRKHPGHFILPLTRKRELLSDFHLYFRGTADQAAVSKRSAAKPAQETSIGSNLQRRLTTALKQEIEATQQEHGEYRVSAMSDRRGKLGIVYDPMHVVHAPPTESPSPENPDRLAMIMDELRAEPDFFPTSATLFSPVDPAPMEALRRVHPKTYIDSMQSRCRRGGGFIGDSTYLTPSSFTVARQAVGGALQAGSLVTNHRYDFAFAMIRPPGHHATTDEYGGYCIFNNAAILARTLQSKHGRKRIMIVDWDAHAANGTMEIFYSDPTVMLVSMHQDPEDNYPRSGFTNQLGKGEGVGYTVNIVMPDYAGDAEYKMVFEELVTPLYKLFNPDFVIACCGFDIHHSERDTHLEVTAAGIHTIFRTIRTLAIGKLAILLEGGYNPSLGRLASTACAALCGRPNIFKEKKDVLSTSAMKRIKTHRIMQERITKQKRVLSDFHTF